MAISEICSVREPVEEPDPIMNPLLVSTAETAEKVLDVDNGLPKPAVKISVLLVLLQLAAPLGPAKMLPAPTQTFSTDPEKPDESASDKSPSTETDPTC